MHLQQNPLCKDYLLRSPRMSQNVAQEAWGRKAGLICAHFCITSDVPSLDHAKQITSMETSLGLRDRAAGWIRAPSSSVLCP